MASSSQLLVVPDSTRFVIMMFPPYGLAWLWLNKNLDKEKKIFGSVGMGLYLLVWLVLVGFVLYFFTPVGVGDEIWGGTTEKYDNREMIKNLERKQKIKEMERQLQELKKAAGEAPKAQLNLNKGGFHVASHGVEAWSPV